MVSKKDQELANSDGGVATMPTAPEGSAERIHDDDELLHPPKASIEPLSHAFCEPRETSRCECGEIRMNCDCVDTPDTECADCGFDRRDHNPNYGQPVTEPGDAQIRVTDYGANGEAVDRGVSPRPKQQEPLPGMPAPPDWGIHQGLPVTRMILGFGGAPNAPHPLAGNLDLDETVWLKIGCSVAATRYKRGKKDEDGTVAEAVGVTSLHIDSCEVLDAALIPNVPPELISKALVTPLVAWAAEAAARENLDLDEVRDILENVAALFDPLPFDEDEPMHEKSIDSDDSANPEDANSPENPDGSQLDQALAEAMAEA